MTTITAEHPTPAKSLSWLVRIGFVARGLTYGVIGGLAIALAVGAGTDHTAPNQQGALALVARAPLGVVALSVAAAGLLAYAGWNLVQAIRGHGLEGGGGSGAFDRVSNLARGLVYLGFFAVALRVIIDGGGSGRQSAGAPRHAAAGVLGWTGGRWLVGAAGVVLVAIALQQAWTAVTDGFTSGLKSGELGQRERRLLLIAGRVGLTARALVFAVCGYFLVRTAVEFQPARAVGVDGALERLHQQALGPLIVGLVGAGLLVFAGYCLLEARYRRL